MNFKSDYAKKIDIMKESFSLIVTPASITSDSAVIFWGKAHKTALYDIYLNGEKYASTDKTVYTLTTLSPDKNYTVKVKFKDLETNEINFRTKKEPKIYDVTSFGAVGDGKTDNTQAIQDAIDNCENGGVVYVGKGTFVTGAIYLKSDMTLKIDGKLFGTDDLTKYPIFQYRFEGREQMCYSSLINTSKTNERLKNIVLCGNGEINANANAVFKKEMEEKKAIRSRSVCLRNIDNLLIKDIKIQSSPAWCLHFIYCDGVTIDNVKVYTRKDENGNKYKIFNGDGIDPDSSKNVYIVNSTIGSQDDCIAIKSGRDEEGRRVGIPSENIYIISCNFESGFGVAMGSEVSGGVKNVLVRDCKFTDTYSVGSVKSPRGRGNVIENIRYSNCTHINSSYDYTDCEWFRGAIYIDNFYSHIEFDPSEKREIDETTPSIRNICFEDISVKTVAGNAIYLAGLMESPLKNIYLKNIKAEGKYGLKAYNIQGFEFENLEVISNEDNNYYMNNVK